MADIDWRKKPYMQVAYAVVNGRMTGNEPVVHSIVDEDGFQQLRKDRSVYFTNYSKSIAEPPQPKGGFSGNSP